MVPTLSGRIQSRIVFLATIGAFWTAVMASVLPARQAGRALAWDERLQDGFVALFWVTAIGVVWECVYHFAMQWRWEKDWPTFLGLLTFLNEGALVYVLGNSNLLPGFVRRVAAHGPQSDVLGFWFFWPLFCVVWFAVWAWSNGPMRVVNLRWRFFGGRFV